MGLSLTDKKTVEGYTNHVRDHRGARHNALVGYGKGGGAVWSSVTQEEALGIELVAGEVAFLTGASLCPGRNF